LKNQIKERSLLGITLLLVFLMVCFPEATGAVSYAKIPVTKFSHLREIPTPTPTSTPIPAPTPTPILIPTPTPSPTPMPVLLDMNVSGYNGEEEGGGGSYGWDGARLHRGMVAADFSLLPYGSKIVIPGLFPGQIFEVRDTGGQLIVMWGKGIKGLDIWFPTVQKASDFGRQNALVVVLETPSH